jgi:hypothetical protein
MPGVLKRAAYGGAVVVELVDRLACRVAGPAARGLAAVLAGRPRVRTDCFNASALVTPLRAARRWAAIRHAAATNVASTI